MSGEKAPKRPRDVEARKKQKTYSDIALIMYESCEPNLCSCVCDDITEHVSNLGNFNTTLHTYVCALGAAWRESDTHVYHNGHELVPRKACRKTLVEQTSELKNIQCDTMVILCHGGEGKAEEVPCMYFFDNEEDIPFSKDFCAQNALMVYSCESAKGPHDGPFEEVIMREVVDDTTLCVVMCCSAGDIVEAHLASLNKGKPRPDDHFYFYFSDRCDCVENKGISGYSIEILISWIINLVDGPLTYSAGTVSLLWLRAIERIMETVKFFGDDKQGFFDFLCAVGLVVDVDEAAKKMQLELERADGLPSDYFRVGGHKMIWVKSPAIKSLLLQFQTLTLVTVHGMTNKVKRNDVMTPAFSDDIQLSEVQGIDTFLKEFKDREKGSGSEQPGESEQESESENADEVRARHRLIFGDSDSESGSVRGMGVRDPELVALLHRLEDMAYRQAKLDTRELFDVLERVQVAQERISVSKLLAEILNGAREHEEGARDGSADTMAAVCALVVKSIEPLVAAPFDCHRVTEALVLLAEELQKIHGDSTAVREYIDETKRRMSECIDLTTIDHG
jgi:hypothetical protein